MIEVTMKISSETENSFSAVITHQTPFKEETTLLSANRDNISVIICNCPDIYYRQYGCSIYLRGSNSIKNDRPISIRKSLAKQIFSALNSCTKFRVEL